MTFSELIFGIFLIVFGLLELILRVFLTVVLTLSIVGIIVLVEATDAGYDLCTPLLWKKIR